MISWSDVCIRSLLSFKHAVGCVCAPLALGVLHQQNITAAAARRQVSCVIIVIMEALHSPPAPLAPHVTLCSHCPSSRPPP